MRHRHMNNRHTFGMLLNRSSEGPRGTIKVDPHGDPLHEVKPATPIHVAGEECVSVETAKRRHALRHGVPTAYWRLRHHHGFMMARPV